MCDVIMNEHNQVVCAKKLRFSNEKFYSRSRHPLPPTASQSSVHKSYDRTRACPNDCNGICFN
jgi:hypothetical protein